MPFGIQPIHIIIVIAVALIIFGPSKLPEMGRGLGRAITEFRKGAQEMTSGFKEELSQPVNDPASQNAAPAAAQPIVQNSVQAAPVVQVPTYVQPASPFTQQSPALVQQTPAVPAAPAVTCASCHAENPAGARFCNSCGSSLPFQIG